MRKKLSSVTFWLLIFFAIILVEAYSSFAQVSDITRTWPITVVKQ
jgi:hypothetical protein